MADVHPEPKKIQGDEGTVEQHSLKDQIDYDQREQAGQQTTPGYGIRLARLLPNGTISPGRSGPASRY